MKYFLTVTLVIFGLAQQPPKPPEGKGVHESASPEIGNQNNNSNQDAKPTNNPPPLPSLSVKVGQNKPSKQNNDTEQADENIRIQGKLVLFTGFLVVIGFLQVGAMLMQWLIIRRQTVIMQIPNRAYLEVGTPQKRLGMEAVFPIENTGHMSALISSVVIEIIVQDRNGLEVYRRHLTKETSDFVVPGKERSLSLIVGFPKEPENAQTIVSGEISYGTGFKTVDVLKFVRVNAGNQWVAASGSIEVHFGESPEANSKT